jgi:hypothetical protein
VLTALPAISVLLGAAGPLSRDGARDEARRELSRHIYDEARPSLLMRALTAIIDAIRSLLGKAASATPGGAFGLLTLVLLITVGIVVVFRLGPFRRPQTEAGGLDVPAATTAAHLRAQAESFAAEQRWAEAVRSRLRAVVRVLEDRTMIEPRPGRTATEVARDAGMVAPPLRPRLDAAAVTFGEVWYGRREASAADYSVVVDLDEVLNRYRPGAATVDPVPPQPAVPA